MAKTLSIILCLFCLILGAEQCLAAGDETWVLCQEHQIYGKMNIFMSRKWFKADCLREGTSLVRRLADKEFYCFNTKKKVYFRGDATCLKKRMALMSHLTADNEVVRLRPNDWREIGSGIYRGLKVKEYQHHGKRDYHLLVATNLGVPDEVFKDHLEFQALPDLGGMPLRLITRTGNKVVTILDTSSAIKKIVNESVLDIPDDAKRVSELFQVSSERTSGLLDSFADLLGD